MTQNTSMYNKDLADAILKHLEKAFPSAKHSDDIREQMPEFKLPREEFHTAIDALMHQGLVTGKPLPEGQGFQYINSVMLTEKGWESLNSEAVTPSKSNLVFLSHAAVDQKLAARVKLLIESAIPHSKVFVSSDPEDLPPGSQWVETILENLSRAAMILILATDRGLNRRWVWYETGAGWSKQLTVIPCCVGTLRKGQLPPPFLGFQQLNIDAIDDLGVLLRAVSKDLALAQAAVDLDACVTDLKAFNLEAAKESGTLPPEQVKFRVDGAHASANIDQGYAENFAIRVKNESSETIVVRKVELMDGLNGGRLTEPFCPDAKNATIKPDGFVQIGWRLNGNPSSNLISLYNTRRNPKDQNFEAQVVIVLGCEILGTYKTCVTRLRVQVDSWNHHITPLIH